MLARVPRLQLREPRQLVAHLLGEAEEHTAPLLGGHFAPAFERAAGGLHRPVDVGGTAVGDSGHDLVPRRIHHVERLSRLSLHPLAVDEHAVALHDTLLPSLPGAVG
jgi:hypothetical protein